MTVVAIVIGRNEGKKLQRCLDSLKIQVQHIVYVDSGSIDNSVGIALAAGVKVVELDADEPFTAARARNAGYRFARDQIPLSEYIQFVDGDCEVDPNWVTNASCFLDSHSEYAIACGRRREIAIHKSRFNRFCDIEWDTPIGDTYACGGDFLIRSKVFDQVDGFTDELIAGEEPELCVRLRTLGWKISRLDVQMTYHNAEITHFSQWWARTIRTGFAFSSVWYTHRKSKYVIWKRETLSAVFWSILLPLIFICALIQPFFILAVLLYLIQLIRIWCKALQSGDPRKQLDWAFFLILGKFPEGYGVIKFLGKLMMKRHVSIIEYK